MSVVGAALRGFGKALKKFGKQKTSGTEVISSVKPAVGISKFKKAVREFLSRKSYNSDFPLITPSKLQNHSK